MNLKLQAENTYKAQVINHYKLNKLKEMVILPDKNGCDDISSSAKTKKKLIIRN